MRRSEPTTVGLTNESHRILTNLTEVDGDFNQMMDGYRFAVGLAVARGGIVDKPISTRTMFNVGSLDPERILYNTVDVLYGEDLEEEPIYKIVERLAEWGIREMDASRVNGEVNYIALLENDASGVKK